MKKLSKDKQQKLLMIGLLTAGALIALWFGAVSTQQASLKNLAERKTDSEQKLREVKQTIANADKIETELGETGKQVAKLEEGMASGDLYYWPFNTLRQFKSNYKVEIPQFSQVDGPKEVSLLPKFPYKQLNLTVAGTAFFNDLGKFIADFENQHPYFRILNLTVEPAGFSGGDHEKLSFKMEIAALVKPGAP